jgi:DNA helicase HerA-like ATPase
MAQKSEFLVIAKSKDEVGILPRMANRHGLVAGATGTGKTVTLRVMSEQFSRIGVPVFMADVKGDLSGIAMPGGDRPQFAGRAQQLGVADFSFEGCPTVFWDVFGQQGHPIRTTISEMGPLLLSRVLDLNDIQSGVLTLVFKIADDNGLLLLDLKDIKAMAQYVGDNAGQFQTSYGNISAASIGAIQRGLLTLEEQGGGAFFGEPALNLQDFMQTGAGGKGVINILAADKLMQAPKLYATFLLWMCRSCSRPCRRWEIRTNRSWFSFLTRHICCSTICRRYFWTRSCRSCGLSAPRGSVSIS